MVVINKDAEAEEDNLKEQLTMTNRRDVLGSSVAESGQARKLA